VAPDEGLVGPGEAAVPVPGALLDGCTPAVPPCTGLYPSGTAWRGLRPSMHRPADPAQPAHVRDGRRGRAAHKAGLVSARAGEARRAACGPGGLVSAALRRCEAGRRRPALVGAVRGAGLAGGPPRFLERAGAGPAAPTRRGRPRGLALIRV